MEKMLAVVFDTESAAYEGSRALAQLDADGSIAVYAQTVIRKNPDGTATVKEFSNEFPAGSIAGTAIGSLIGLLEGPVGLALGATTGMLAGMVGDLYTAGVDAKFVDDTAALLTPGKFAVVADISEEWETPVDTTMEALGGTAVRTVRQVVEQDQRARETARLRDEIGQLKAEYDQAQAEGKARLKARIDKLEADLQSKADEASQRAAQMQQEAEAKIGALRKKAEETHGEIKAVLEARAARIQRDFEASQTNIRRLLAEQLKAAAARIEK